MANKKVDLHLDLSELDSDDGRNCEKLKRSRHSRCIKKNEGEIISLSGIKKENRRMFSK